MTPTLILLAAATASPPACAAVTTTHQAYAAPVAAVQTHAAATYAAQTYVVPVPVLAFAYQYVPPPAAAEQKAEDGHADKLDAILKRLEAIEGRTPAVLPQTAHAAPAETFDAAGKALLAKACLRCHTSAVADAKGGGFSLSAIGNTPNDKRAALKQVEAGTMPPGGGLSAADRKALVEYLSAGK